MTRKMNLLAIASAVLLVPSLLLAEEHAVKEKDVPAPALAAVTKKYPSAKKTGFARETEKGKTVYEVQIVDGKNHIDVDVTAEGKISAEESVIPAEALPEAVKSGLAASAWKTARIKRVEKVITDENEADPRYELVLVQGKKSTEVLFDKTGKVVEQEAR